MASSCFKTCCPQHLLTFFPEPLKVTVLTISCTIDSSVLWKENQQSEIKMILLFSIELLDGDECFSSDLSIAQSFFWEEIYA